MARFICNVEHSKLGALEVSETANGSRIYAKSSEFGALQFQSAKQQAELRSLVIKAGHGDLLSKKPSPLEVANFAPERAPEVSVSSPEDLQGAETVSVAEVVETSKPEPVPETPKKKSLFKVGLFGGNQ